MRKRSRELSATRGSILRASILYRLIHRGRTDAVMFDADRPTPSLLQAGDLVQFVPV